MYPVILIIFLNRWLLIPLNRYPSTKSMVSGYDDR